MLHLTLTGETIMVANGVLKREDTVERMDGSLWVVYDTEELTQVEGTVTIYRKGGSVSDQTTGYCSQLSLPQSR